MKNSISFALASVALDLKPSLAFLASATIAKSLLSGASAIPSSAFAPPIAGDREVDGDCLLGPEKLTTSC